MAQPKNQQVLFVKRPNPTPSLELFKIEEIPYPGELRDGEITVKARYVSVDPYMRGRMNATRSYADPWELNKAPIGGQVVEVIESKNPRFSKGDLCLGYLPWILYQNVPEGVSKQLNLIPAALKDYASYFIGRN
jgi:NADPH-dependent curcumin reductase CurA